MNLDHDVFAKKLQSIELANQVEEFLQSKALTEPTQIPFGYSGINLKPDWNRSPILKNQEQPKAKPHAPNNAPREKAKFLGFLKFEGTACATCKGTERYTCNAKCVACTSQYNRLKDKREFKGSNS